MAAWNRGNFFPGGVLRSRSPDFAKEGPLGVSIVSEGVEEKKQRQILPYTIKRYS